MAKKINGKRISLRTLTLRDSKELADKINDKDIARWTSNIPHPYSEKDALKYIKECQKKRQRGEAYQFCIISEDNQLVGGIGIFSIDKKNKNAEIGYWIAKDYWGKGIATEAVSLMLDFGFSELNLHRVYARVLGENIGSQKVLEKSGFTFEGNARKSEFKNNKWNDMLNYGILNKEHKKKKSI